MKYPHPSNCRCVRCCPGISRPEVQLSFRRAGRIVPLFEVRPRYFNNNVNNDIIGYRIWEQSGAGWFHWPDTYETREKAMDDLLASKEKTYRFANEQVLGEFEHYGEKDEENQDDQ